MDILYLFSLLPAARHSRSDPNSKVNGGLEAEAGGAGC